MTSRCAKVQIAAEARKQQLNMHQNTTHRFWRSRTPCVLSCQQGHFWEFIHPAVCSKTSREEMTKHICRHIAVLKVSRSYASRAPVLESIERVAKHLSAAPRQGKKRLDRLIDRYSSANWVCGLHTSSKAQAMPQQAEQQQPGPEQPNGVLCNAMLLACCS